MTDYNKKPYDKFPQDMDELFVDDNINSYGHSGKTLDELEKMLDSYDVTERIRNHEVYYSEYVKLDWRRDTNAFRKNIEGAIEKLSREVSKGDLERIQESKSHAIDLLWDVYDMSEDVEKRVREEYEEKTRIDARAWNLNIEMLERITNVVKHAIAEVRKRDKSVFKMFLKR